jgi:hypothetical protein
MMSTLKSDIYFLKKCIFGFQNGTFAACMHLHISTHRNCNHWTKILIPYYISPLHWLIKHRVFKKFDLLMKYTSVLHKFSLVFAVGFSLVFSLLGEFLRGACRIFAELII